MGHTVIPTPIPTFPLKGIGSAHFTTVDLVKSAASHSSLLTVFAMPTIQVNGVAVDITQIGAGRDLVLLHSLLADRTAFDRVAPALAKKHRVTLVNLPGYGASAPHGASVEDYADHVAGLLRALKLPRETDVLGNGLGGFIAIALACRHGDFVRQTLHRRFARDFSARGQGTAAPDGGARETTGHERGARRRDQPHVPAGVRRGQRRTRRRAQSGTREGRPRLLQPRVPGTLSSRSQTVARRHSQSDVRDGRRARRRNSRARSRANSRTEFPAPDSWRFPSAGIARNSKSRTFL